MSSIGQNAVLNFCTMFDSSYLSRGLAMYESLKEHCNDFNLYIVAFDDKCLEVLKTLNLSNVHVLALNDFEDKELLDVKPTRTLDFYRFTCTPSVILYIIEKYNAEVCTYIDADLYLYSSPQVLLDELRDNSVIITEQRFTPKYDWTGLVDQIKLKVLRLGIWQQSYGRGVLCSISLCRGPCNEPVPSTRS